MRPLPLPSLPHRDLDGLGLDVAAHHLYRRTCSASWRLIEMESRSGGVLIRGGVPHLASSDGGVGAPVQSGDRVWDSSPPRRRRWSRPPSSGVSP
jgi:hypothetical protein